MHTLHASYGIYEVTPNENEKRTKPTQPTYMYKTNEVELIAREKTGKRV